MYWHLIVFLQIVVETLPVSSSGHILLLEQFILCFTSGLAVWQGDGSFGLQEMVHIVHLPTLLVLALFFGSRWYAYILSPIRLWKYLFSAAVFTLCADAVTVALYLFKPAIGQHYLPLGFVITTVALASLYWCPQRGTQPLRWYHALIIGLVQGIALLPGISRLASVFVTTRWLGYSNRQAFEISWMIQVPLIAAAAAKGLLLLYKNHSVHLFNDWHLWVMVIVATVISWYTLHLCAWLVRTNRVWWCAVYMVIPFIVSILMMKCL